MMINILLEQCKNEPSCWFISIDEPYKDENIDYWIPCENNVLFNREELIDGHYYATYDIEQQMIDDTPVVYNEMFNYLSFFDSIENNRPITFRISDEERFYDYEVGFIDITEEVKEVRVIIKNDYTDNK